MTIARRGLLQAAGAAALGLPHVARAAAGSVLKYVPEADLTVLDPVWTTAGVTRNHGYVVFDTLYGVDADFVARPQMVAGHRIERDGLEWQLTLRDGLRFHDGEPVRAQDVVPSLQRWGRRDAFGSALLAATDEIAVASDQMVRIRLKRPFPLLPDALGKNGGNMACIMPERLARTDAMTRVNEVIGSGPFRFVADEWQQGARIVYARFDGYLPRADGVASLTAGPKHAYFDRLEWHIIPDPATSAAALRAGEVDWVLRLTPDITPTLRRDPNLVVARADQLGTIEFLRFNQLHPPFDNPAIRRAILGAVNQTDVMTAAGGTDQAMWDDRCGVFPRGTPLASDAGLEVLTGRRDLDAVRRALAAAGYANERVVFLGIADVPEYQAMSEVVADMFRRIGMNIDYQPMDYGTTVARRSSMEPVEKGGWSMLLTGFGGADMASPASNVPLRGNGRAGWFGWATAPRLEALRDAWFAAPDLVEQQAVGREMQLQAWRDVPFIPLGKLLRDNAYRADLTGMLPGQPIFWNVRRE